MKKTIVFLLLLLAISQSLIVQAEIKKTTSNGIIHYELDTIKLQAKEFIKSTLYPCPYQQRDCKVKLKAQTQLIQGQYMIWLVLSLENSKYELGSCYITLSKYAKGKSEEYTLFPTTANYNNWPPTMQWVDTIENTWGIKYPSTWQKDCLQGKSNYEFSFPLALTDFADLLSGEELELSIRLNHSTLKYEIKNLNDLQKLEQQVKALSKQPASTNNAPAYSLEIFKSAEQLKGLLSKNIYSPELAGLLAKLGSKDVIYLQNFRSYYYKENGLSITVSDTGEIFNIGLHNTRFPNQYKTYQGELPAGITFEDKRRMVEAKLGTPPNLQIEEPGRFSAVYQGFFINYYTKDKDNDYSINSVVLFPDPPVQPQTPVVPVDTQEFISLLGQNIKDPKVQPLRKSLGVEQLSSLGKYTYYLYPQRDAFLKVDTATLVIQTIWFRPNALGFQPYRGSFEGDISLLDLRCSVEEKLGKPVDSGHNDSGAFWAKYQTGAKVQYQYHSATNMLNPVASLEFSLENEPPAQPGAYILNLLGKTSNSPEVSAFFGSLYRYSILEHSELTRRFTNLAFEVNFPWEGIDLLFVGQETPYISSITLYGDFFSGSLPGGITFSDDRESIRKKLGKPVDSFGDKFPVDQFVIGGKVNLSVIYYAPDNSPGKYLPQRINITQNL